MKQLSLRSGVLIMVVSVFGVAASWMMDVRTERKTVFATVELRDTSIKLQQARSRFKRLEDDRETVLLKHIGEHVSVMQIRLADFLSSVSKSNEFSGMSYDQVLLSPDLQHDVVLGDSGTFDRKINVVRLDLTVKLSDGAQMIRLFAQLRSVLGGWPIQTRGCDVKRLPMQGLESRCVLDVYHWTKLTNGRTQ